ncbi:MAG: AzlD domain-containing protein [Gammaproteobacteria bacterium]|nr:AzlD domain-containing protein [Gammaproteobacteria bacterium]
MTDPVWLIILVIGAGTFFWRGAFLVFGGHLTLPTVVRRGLNYVPPAAFAALVLPGLVQFDGATGSVDEARLLAGLVAGLVAWRSRSTLWTLAAGMGVLWLLRALL